MKIITWFLSTLLFYGCASAGGKQSFDAGAIKVPENKALVYLYRPRALFGVVGSPKITVDGNVMGSLKNNGYTSMILNPGKHHFQAEWSFFGRPNGTKDVKSSFNLQAGKIYYLRYDVANYEVTPTGVVAMPILATGSFEFHLVNKNGAITELSVARKLTW